MKILKILKNITIIKIKKKIKVIVCILLNNLFCRDNKNELYNNKEDIKTKHMSLMPINQNKKENNENVFSDNNTMYKYII